MDSRNKNERDRDPTSDLRGGPSMNEPEPTAPKAYGAGRRPQGFFGDLGTADSEAEPPRPGRSAVPPAWIQQLRESHVFQAAMKCSPIPEKDRDITVDKAIAACRLLVASGGRASSRNLALATGCAPRRVDGLMSRIVSILNAAGETCLSKDAATDNYELDLDRLQLVFQISLTKR